MWYLDTRCPSEVAVRNQVHDSRLWFRANSDLVHALQAKAEARRMSPSEYLRDVVRREVLEAA
jgi:hypothetical protein